MPQDFHGFPYPERLPNWCRGKESFMLNSFEPIGAHRESIHTTKFQGQVTLTTFILFRGRKRRDWSESSQTCSSSVSFSFMNGWKHESRLIIENNNFILKCIQTCTLWNAPNLITSLLPWYGLQSRWGGAGRTKKSAFVSSIEIGSDTGLFPAFCHAAMASETMAQQESGEHVVAAWGWCALVRPLPQSGKQSCEKCEQTGRWDWYPHMCHVCMVSQSSI